MTPTPTPTAKGSAWGILITEEFGEVGIEEAEERRVENER